MSLLCVSKLISFFKFTSWWIRMTWTQRSTTTGRNVYEKKQGGKDWNWKTVHRHLNLIYLMASQITWNRYLRLYHLVITRFIITTSRLTKLVAKTLDSLLHSCGYINTNMENARQERCGHWQTHQLSRRWFILVFKWDVNGPWLHWINPN